MANNRRITRGATAIDKNISKEVLKKVSEVRRSEIRDAISKMEIANNPVDENNKRAEPVLSHSAPYRTLRKQGASASTVLPGTRSSTDLMGPEVYSPLFQLANLNLPRDRVTMNAWNRIFYDTHPIVRNAINLHASFPISKINISHKSKKVEEFFLEMAEKIDLYSAVYGVALEFWRMGEAFPYAEIDKNTGTWKVINIMNPDYIHVRKSPIGNHSMVSIRPDAGLLRLVNSKNPADLELKRRLPDHIVNSVRKGQNIPLSDFNISHLKLLSSPYDVRGTSIIVSVYKDLMLYDKLRECFDVETELLTNQGFKKYKEIIDETTQQILPNIKVASYLENKDKIEYVTPTNSVIKDFNGKMKYFHGEKLDCMVTPNHRIYSSKKTKKGWQPYEINLAKNMDNGSFYKFKTRAEFNNLNTLTEVNIGNDISIPIETYLKFAGYVVSEGCIYIKNRKDKRCRDDYEFTEHKVITSQLPTSPCYNDMKNTFSLLANACGKKLSENYTITKSGFSITSPKEIWQGIIHGKNLTLHCAEQFGIDGQVDSYHKRIPRWILDLNPELQRIMLSTLIAGDGSIIKSKHENGSTTAYRYNTVSKQLADDVYEMVYKCGFTPNLHITKRPNRDFEEYVVLWSDSNYGNEPTIYNNPKYTGGKISDVDYNDKVWCVEVPSGLVVTRRNGRISIQGQCKFAQADGMVNPLTLVKIGSETYKATQADIEAHRMALEEAQFDKDFKLVTHDGVSIERIGFSGATLDVAADIELINDNIYAGLMVPKALIQQESATYASSSIGLEVLRQRYDIFRNMIKKWLEQKIFAPIAELQDFFDYSNGEKVLQVPNVDFNHMNLYDMSDYIQSISGFVGSKQVSLHTVYRSLGLSYEEEMRRLDQEAIDVAIKAKKEAILGGMRLSDLEALDVDSKLIEPTDAALGGGLGGLPDGGDDGGLPGMDELPGLGGMPPGGDLGGPPPAGPPPGGAAPLGAAEPPKPAGE